MKGLVAFATFLTLALAQQQGNQKQNEHLTMNIESCEAGMVCKKEKASITLDSNWRWTHKTGDYTNCYTGNTWDQSICPDGPTCTQNCAIDGVDKTDWTGTYGVTSDNDEAITLKFVTHGPYSTNIGSRLYLLDESEEKYKMFYLKNREFTFDVDVSKLPCGLNGALYFVEMMEDGGKSEFPGNKVGASYGTGYCDAQCPHDMKWINGEANCEEWEQQPTDQNSGWGKYGTCCVEMDIWEANSMAMAYTPHTCDTVSQVRCEGEVECGDDPDHRYDGLCDKDGCDFNPYRMGVKDYFGPGSQFSVDSTKPMTVVTQFLTDDNTDTGSLSEIRRVFVQDGKVIEHPRVSVPGMTDWDSITPGFCQESKEVFGDPDGFNDHNGFQGMGEALDRGMVLVMSMWDDHAANMLWLDSNYPLDKDPSEPGVARGPCPTDSGDPADMESQYPDATVKYYNVKYGPIGSTYPGGDDFTTDSAHTTEPPVITTRPPPPDDCPGGSLHDCIQMCMDNCPNFCPGGSEHECIQKCMDLCPNF